MDENIYVAKGYADREAYLEELAEEYGLSYEKVLYVADILGEKEDFDGLINELEELEANNESEMCPQCKNEDIKPYHKYFIICGLELKRA